MMAVRSALARGSVHAVLLTQTPVDSLEGLDVFRHGGRNNYGKVRARLSLVVTTLFEPICRPVLHRLELPQDCSAPRSVRADHIMNEVAAAAAVGHRFKAVPGESSSQHRLQADLQCFPFQLNRGLFPPVMQVFYVLFQIRDQLVTFG